MNCFHKIIFFPSIVRVFCRSHLYLAHEHGCGNSSVRKYDFAGDRQGKCPLCFFSRDKNRKRATLPIPAQTLPQFAEENACVLFALEPRSVRWVDHDKGVAGDEFCARRKKIDFFHVYPLRIHTCRCQLLQIMPDNRERVIVSVA